MKRRFIVILSLFLAMEFLPALSIRQTTALNDSPSRNSSSSGTEARQTDGTEDCFVILDTESGKTFEINERKFLYGALSYEMPPSFEPEALKAQAVAVYTYFSRLRNVQRSSPDPELKGADFSADLSAGQFYLSEDQLKERWGSSFEQSYKKIKAACDSVYGLVLTDKNGELIDAAYHAISNGSTENAEDVFGIKNEHLSSVASPGDAFAPDYITDVVFSGDEFRDTLKAADNKISFSGKPEDYIKSIDRTAAGTVRSIDICGCTFTGDQIRKAFSLRSAAFEVEYSGSLFTFTVRGYGHGVGLSQYGAQYMAKNGAGYKEILTHYYTNVLVKNNLEFGNRN